MGILPIINATRWISDVTSEIFMFTQSKTFGKSTASHLQLNKTLINRNLMLFV